MDVRGKVALVTGSARGLGKGYAEALLKRGAKVTLTDVLVDTGRATADEFKEQYGVGNVIFIQGDVTKQQDMEAVFEQTVQEFGGLDILICNAGILIDRDPELIFSINLFGLIRCCELALERMRTDKGGSGGVIVNIASIAGLVTVSVHELYHATKHAIVGYTGSLAKRLEAQKCGVRMVALCPGTVRTEMAKSVQYKDDMGDPVTKAILETQGGWTDMSVVVDTCMRLIEKDVPAGSIVKVDNISIGIAQTDDLTFSPLP